MMTSVATRRSVSRSARPIWRLPLATHAATVATGVPEGLRRGLVDADEVGQEGRRTEIEVSIRLASMCGRCACAARCRKTVRRALRGLSRMSSSADDTGSTRCPLYATVLVGLGRRTLSAGCAHLAVFVTERRTGRMDSSESANHGSRTAAAPLEYGHRGAVRPSTRLSVRPIAVLSRTRHLAQGHSATFAWFRRISSDLAPR